MDGAHPGYEHQLEHLVDEIAWVRALVEAHLSREGRSPFDQASREDRASSFAVSPDEAKRLLEPTDLTAPPPGDAALLRVRIEHRLRATAAAGPALPLQRLCAAFELEELDRMALTILLVGEVDVSMRRLFAYAWNDFTRKTPTVEFVASLLQPTVVGTITHAEALMGGSPLVRSGLVQVGPAKGQGPEPFMARSLRVNPSVVAYLIGRPELDPILAGSATVLAAEEPDHQLIMADSTRELVTQQIQMAASGSLIVVLVGPKGVGKTAQLRSHLRDHGGTALEVCVARLLHPGDRAQARVRALMRDARMLEAMVVLDLAEASLEAPEHAASLRLLADLASAHPYGAVATARDQASWFVGLLDNAAIVNLPLPEKEERTVAWRTALKESGLGEPAVDLLEAAVRYPLTVGAITTAAAAVAAAGRARGAAPSVDDAGVACRAQLTPRLSGIAQRIMTTFVWSDLILPGDAQEQLQEVVAYQRNRHQVFEQWGYGRILPYGRGLSVLFSGPPGTGKTMAAGIIAGELGMELFRVDLSRTVSKYIGETEKNLARVFDEASQSKSVLLFDEADSLFAKRTEVKSSVDRYANLEVNYLLQRVEDFEGVTVLTTNFDGSLDKAFRRRIRFHVKFPAPDAETRAFLWRKMVPERANVVGEIDFDALGHDYELSGGHIKNAALRAAFAAAQKGGGIAMEDLCRAARLECHHLGMVVRSSDGPDEAKPDTNWSY